MERKEKKEPKQKKKQKGKNGNGKKKRKKTEENGKNRKRHRSGDPFCEIPNFMDSAYTRTGGGGGASYFSGKYHDCVRDPIGNVLVGPRKRSRKRKRTQRNTEDKKKTTKTDEPKLEKKSRALMGRPQSADKTFVRARGPKSRNPEAFDQTRCSRTFACRSCPE